MTVHVHVALVVSNQSQAGLRKCKTDCTADWHLLKTLAVLHINDTCCFHGNDPDTFAFQAAGAAFLYRSLLSGEAGGSGRHFRLAK